MPFHRAVSAPWIATRDGEYVVTEDRTRIARFASADEARLHGRPLMSGCLVCGVHADEFRGCNCAPVVA